MRHRSARFLTLLACGLASGTASADPDHTYLEEGGIVLFEVEDAEPADGWELKTDLADYEGSGFFEWTNRDYHSVSSAGQGSITYHFRIQTPGNYQMRWRSQIALGDESTESNDSWIRLATGEDVPENPPMDGWTKVYMSTLGRWDWTSQRAVHEVGHSVRQYFAQGDHTLEISGRSRGHAIDRIALYRYQDVQYNANEINDWPLSSIVKGDGTVVVPDDTDAEEPVAEEPDPEENSPEVPVIRENLFTADAFWNERTNNECVDNTLALPASAILSFNPSDSENIYTSAEYLSISASESVLLVKFDMSLVPVAGNAAIEYSTGEQSSNGSIRYSLGSHSNWPEDSEGHVLPPDEMVELALAAGGWENDSRHQSVLPVQLLPSHVNTIMISSSDVDGDPLDIFANAASTLAPRLLITGDDNFCQNWEDNVNANNVPVEPPAEVDESPEPEPENEVTPPETEEEPDTTQAPETRKDSKGGSLSWLVLLTLSTSLLRKFVGRSRSKRST